MRRAAGDSTLPSLANDADELRKPQRGFCESFVGEESAGMMGNNLRAVSSEGCFASKLVGRGQSLRIRLISLSNKAASQEVWGNV